MLYVDWLRQLSSWLRRKLVSLAKPACAAVSGWVLGLAGCEGASSIAVEPAPTAPASAVATPDAAAAARRAPDARADAKGGPIGSFRFTMYYVAQEADHGPSVPPVDAGATLASVSGAPDIADEADAAVDAGDPGVVLYEKDCTELARVSSAFARSLGMQGTGKLRDGRVVNTSGACRCPRSPCYEEIEQAWAMGANGRLSPFRSVAVDTSLIELGTMLYIPELDGTRMPGRAPWGGFVHDGCVVADDRGGGIDGKHLDLFVAKKPYSSAIYNRNRLKQVTVFDGKGWCERHDGKVGRAGGARS